MFEKSTLAGKFFAFPKGFFYSPATWDDLLSNKKLQKLTKYTCIFDYEIYANSSNGEYLDDENNLVLNEDESPDSILQRSPGIVPRRFNKNAKVREPSFADSSTVNQSNEDRRVNFNP